MKYLFLLSLFFPVTALADVRIGNSGEGVLVNDKIYVRDLYESDAHLDPWVGPATFSTIKQIWEKRSKLHNLSTNEVLLRKLSDIEILSPGYGIAVLEALAFNQFIFLKNLALLPSDSNNIPDSMRVQLAVRTSATIYINETAWKKMDDTSRAALLIHEAIHSFTRLECKDSRCIQRSTAIRPLVGSLFLKDRREPFLEQAQKVLNVTDLTPVCQAGTRLTLEATNGIGFSQRYQFLGPIFKQDIKNYCSKIFANTKKNETLLLTINVQRLAPLLKSIVYRTPEDRPELGDYGQIATKLTLDTETLTKAPNVDSIQHCEATVEKEVLKLLNKDLPRRINPQLICD